MDQDYGIFIGLSCVPAYSKLSFKYEEFIINNIDPCFSGYRDSLNEFIGNVKLNESLYRPIHFRALGNFDNISLCLIDDFYFGNFHFRPYNKNIKKHQSATNFQYQVINAVENIYVNLNHFNELEKYNFIGICKLKLHPDILKNNNYELIDTFKVWLKNFISDNGKCATIISSSFSWHEFTLIFAYDNLSTIVEVIKKIRKSNSQDLRCFNNSIKFGNNELLQHVFVDTQTTYGISNSLFKIKSKEFTAYKQNNLDKKVSLTSKLQIKTGHGEEIKKIIQNLSRNIVSGQTKLTDGRSDYTITFKSIYHYILFWNDINSKVGTRKDLFLHIRKIHTNIYVITSKSLVDQIFDWIFNLFSHQGDINSGTLKTNYISSFVCSEQFQYPEILAIEKNLKKLNVSKETSNSIISAYLSFNDLITDITLGQYILDLKPILNNLRNIIFKFALNDSSVYEFKDQKDYHNIKDLSSLLLNYIEIWQISFQNRFQDSKRFGYNSDSKGEFNGGVHQLIQAFDRLYKFIVYSFQIPLDLNKDYLPVATYGSQRIGISSTLNNLRLNYFQLFQPEIFLTVLPKESLNQQLYRYYFADNSLFKDNIIEKLIKQIEKINNLIHEENDIRIKKRLFEFCTPDTIKLRVNYIITYYLYADSMFGRKNLANFKKWFWFIYVQTSENYNRDGSVRVNILRRTLFDFNLVITFFEPEFDLRELRIIFKDTDFEFLLYNKPDTNDLSLIDECYEITKYLETKGIIDDIRQINSHIIDLSSFLTEPNEIKDFYNEFRDFSMLKIQEIIDISSQNGKFLIFKRDIYSGSGIRDENYSDLLINSQGGFFSLNNDSRIKLLKLRIEIIKFILTISSKYKNSIIS